MWKLGKCPKQSKFKKQFRIFQKPELNSPNLILGYSYISDFLVLFYFLFFSASIFQKFGFYIKNLIQISCAKMECLQ